jgi:hypothetical protein
MLSVSFSGNLVLSRTQGQTKENLGSLGRMERSEIMDVVEMINKYGFPIVAAGGMGYLIFYVWKWATTEIKPVLSEANKVLIGLIDRIRMLDNDLIRLNQKINIVLMLRGKVIEAERVRHEEKLEEEAEKKSGRSSNK